VTLHAKFITAALFNADNIKLFSDISLHTVIRFCRKTTTVPECHLVNIKELVSQRYDRLDLEKLTLGVLSLAHGTKPNISQNVNF